MLFTAYNKKEDSPETLEVNQEEEKLIEDFKKKVIYRVILAAEEEQKVFTQWLKAGRDYNLMIGKDKNFYSHWCNDDMEFSKDGTLASDEPMFVEANEEGGDD